MSTTATNPLLADGLPAFAAIRPEHCQPAIEALIERYQAFIDQVGHTPAEKIDFDGVVWQESRHAQALANAWSTIGHVQRVNNTAEWRDAFQACLPLISAFATERNQHPALYQAYQALAERGDVEDQPVAVQTAINHQLRDFRLAGVDQPSEVRDSLKKSMMRLSELSNQFGNHVLDATDAFQVHFESKAPLAGLPDDALAQMAERAKAHDKPGFVADLSFPSYRAIVTYADDRELRERFYHAHLTRASELGPLAGEYDNTAIVKEILALRDDIARRLGFAHHGEYQLQTRMADTVEDVETMLENLAAQAKPKAVQQLNDLSEFAKAEGATLPLQPWDVPYYTEKYRSAVLGIDDEAIKPYFEVDRVFTGLFDTATRLFEITFERDDRVETWHETVRYYHVKNAQGEPMAGLYLDIYARAKKAGGAWMDVCRSRWVHQDTRQLPVAYLTCNFAPPTAGRPSLLTHDDVVTLFHEFGHCLHHLLTEVDLPDVAGIHGVEWDAVELPSQLLEGWSLAQQAISTYARHVDTGEPLPEPMLQSIRANRQFQGALALTRQIQFALTDLALHKQRVDDPLGVAREVEARIAIMPAPDYNRFLLSFSHLFNGGYSAGYYSYLWAERLARDAFSMFEDQGVYDPTLGRRLAEAILSVGGTRPMQASWLAFAGRPARIEPLLEAYGIDDKAA
ncbi:MAG: M3 family metallopeptidase [Wenzhouxiangella sp.]|nr:M3 family metallopeptidase [Wenzhouxiangella sp.]